VFLRLLLLFTLVPLVELILLIWIGRHTGWTTTLALILVPGIAGAWLARRQGLRCWRTVQEQLARGDLPAGAVLDGLLILVAGVFLIAPGVLTDLAGVALLVPPLRRLLRGFLVHRLRSRITFFTPSGRRPAEAEDEQIIDVEHRPPDESSP